MVHRVEYAENVDPTKALPAVLDILESISQKQVSSHGATGGDNAFYGGISKDGKHSYYEYPCHYNTRYLSGCQIAYSAYAKPHADHNAEEMTRAYLRWITGKSSPWRSIFPMAMSLGKQKHFTKKFFYDKGFIFDKLDTAPANFLQNFLIGTRMPKEWPVVCKSWYNLVKDGIHPNVAFVVVSQFNLGEAMTESEITAENLEYVGDSPDEWDGSLKNFKWLFSKMNKYDWPINNWTGSQEYMLNFIHGTPDTSRFTQPFAKNPKYWPVNYLWGKDKAPKSDEDYPSTPGDNLEKDELYSTVIQNTYMGKIGKIVKGTGFNKDLEYWYVNNKELKEIGHAEEIRLAMAQ